MSRNVEKPENEIQEEIADTPLEAIPAAQWKA